MAKEQGNERGKRDSQWRRRQALQLAAQLPDGQIEQLAIIRDLRWLVKNYLSDTGKKPANA